LRGDAVELKKLLGVLQCFAVRFQRRAVLPLRVEFRLQFLDE
jgi:hypothetical protein